MTIDPAEIIAAELARHTLRAGNTCACGRSLGEDDLALPEWDRHLADATAAALTAAGLVGAATRRPDPRQRSAMSTDQDWTTEDVELIVARALEDVQPPESDPARPDEAFIADARRVLSALADAGWSLLPPGCETRTEWAARKPGAAEPWTRVYHTERELDEKLHSRRNHPLFGGPQEKLTRTVHDGTWRPADTEVAGRA